MENESYKKSQQLKLMEVEKHQCDIKILELTEALKSEKASFELKIDQLQREREAEILKIGEDLQSLKQELSKAESVNVDLLEDLK